jgi:ribonuclease P protein component
MICSPRSLFYWDNLLKQLIAGARIFFRSCAPTAFWHTQSMPAKLRLHLRKNLSTATENLFPSAVLRCSFLLLPFISSSASIAGPRGEDFMKFSSSLKKNHIFRRLYASKGIANSYLVLYARPNRSGHNYIGITVSKKLGHAVVRNRTRRRIREVYRIHEDRFTSGWDIVVVARTRSVNAEFGDLTHAYLSLAQKAGLLRPLPESEVTP